MSSVVIRWPKFKIYDFSDKNDKFHVPMLYMKLLDRRAIHRWEELFKPKKLKWPNTCTCKYYVHIW